MPMTAAGGLATKFGLNLTYTDNFWTYTTLSDARYAAIDRALREYYAETDREPGYWIRDGGLGLVLVVKGLRAESEAWSRDTSDPTYTPFDIHSSFNTSNTANYQAKGPKTFRYRPPSQLRSIPEKERFAICHILL